MESILVMLSLMVAAAMAGAGYALVQEVRRVRDGALDGAVRREPGGGMGASVCGGNVGQREVVLRPQLQLLRRRGVPALHAGRVARFNPFGLCAPTVPQRMALLICSLIRPASVPTTTYYYYSI
ncbi:hypothetical protein SASPL_101196 [Salvia splendens]|uniref:Uncharacterized protein n=1 Tax=Salvia splendens TaxID=180675 RepID=A0A8X9ABP4_SALSN|nr:hypothetical protein SASPL_101196 [Salvia splendens]